MTDARLRGGWLNTMRFDDLSDTAWRVFTSGLMWSAENGTNGLVPNRYLRMLHPNGEQPEACRELAAAALGVQEATGFVFLDWDGALGQSTDVQVETYKANGRKRARDYRERERQKLAKAVGFVVFEAKGTPAPVTRDVTRYVRPHVGKGKGEGEGAAIHEVFGDETQLVNQQTGEVTGPSPVSWPTAIPGGWAEEDGAESERARLRDYVAPYVARAEEGRRGGPLVAKPLGQVTVWPVAEIPKSTPPKAVAGGHACSVCGQAITNPESVAEGLCRKTTKPHEAARRALAAA